MTVSTAASLNSGTVAIEREKKMQKVHLSEVVIYEARESRIFMGDNTATAGVEHMIGLSPLWVSFYSCNQGGAVTRGIFFIKYCRYISE